ncbi:MAG: DUF883 family protein [Verrucomicrobiota bacterium]|nr:DUF883 family protein [Verrucomicrobiota bacterium]
MTGTRLENAAEAVKDAATGKLGEMKAKVQHLEELARERAKATDRIVRSHPYETIGLACAVTFGLGLLIGVLARRN